PQQWRQAAPAGATGPARGGRPRRRPRRPAAAAPPGARRRAGPAPRPGAAGGGAGCGGGAPRRGPRSGAAAGGGRGARARGPGVGLHVRVLGAEELARTAARDVLDLVDDLVASVVALAGVALAVLVGEDGPGGPEHLGRGEVLGSDQLQGGVLALDLTVDEREHLVVADGRPGHVPTLRADGPGTVLGPTGRAGRASRPGGGSGGRQQGVELGDAPRVAPAFELRVQERLDGFLRDLGADEPLAERDHVRVVVLAGEVRGRDVVH